MKPSSTVTGVLLQPPKKTSSDGNIKNWTMTDQILIKYETKGLEYKPKLKIEIKSKLKSAVNEDNI